MEGNCVDMPNEPPESNFKDKIHLKAYPTVELGGVIWGYLGPKEKVPALPKFEWTQAPESHRHVTKTWQESNWLQALEGGIDSDHASFLHRAIAANTKRAGSRGYHNKWKGTKLEVRRTDFGLLYGNTRYLGEEGNYVVTTHYVLPFHTFFATGTDPLSSFVDLPIHGHIFVPRDDENTMIYNLTYYYSEAPPGDKRWRETIDHYRGRDPGEQTADFRKVRNKENDWLIDRRVQKTETFTGIDGINTQDHAVQESMGSIVDRTREHLSRTDKAVIMARQLLIEAAKAVQTGGDPPGLKPTYYRVRALARLLPGDADWWETLKDQIFPQPPPSA